MATGSTDKCGVCETRVSEKDKAIMCEICELWFHCKCEKVPDETYRVLKKDEGIHWYCRSCDKGVAKILTAIGVVKKRQDKFEADLDLINTKITELSDQNDKLKKNLDLLNSNLEKQKQRYEETINKVEQQQNKLEDRIENNEIQIVNREEIEKLTKDYINDGSWADIVKKEMGGRMDNVEAILEQNKKELENVKEREQRKNGIVLYNASEDNNSKNFEEQVEKDLKFVCDFMSYILDEDFERNEIKKILRMGKRDYRQQSEEVPCRPLLIVFVNGETKNYVMNNVFRLRQAGDAFKKVIVNHDMTAMDRAEIKKLVQEAKVKEENDHSGEWIYRVRGLPGQATIIKLRKRRD